MAVSPRPRPGDGQAHPAGCRHAQGADIAHSRAAHRARARAHAWPLGPPPTYRSSGRSPMRESSPSNGCPESARDARPLVDDLLIRGGLVIDGTGAPGREADVSVSAGRIGAIAPRSERPARRVIDARGQVVAPGFIDIHTHSDFTLPLNPRAESKIRQGVTLEVVGNCGFSVAPALPGRAAMLREYQASSAPWLPFGETSFADYVAAFPSTALNVILQVGHNTLRLMTAGMDNRAVTADELAAMERLLAEALAAGAWGMSSGLFTAPGAYADAAEIHALARVLRRHGAAYSSHIRDEANHVTDAVREAIAVAEATGVHVQIAHLKLSGVDNWGGAAPSDAWRDFVSAARGETRILVTSMSDKDVHAISGTPWVTVGSDANSLATAGVTSQGKPHPRSYGTHARLLGPFVRDLKLLTLPAAVHKTTGAAAAALGLTDRGVLREGGWADIAVFDPERITDRATYDDPHRYAVGVSTVLVNGEVVVDGGDHTGALPGRLLRRA